MRRLRQEQGTEFRKDSSGGVFRKADADCIGERETGPEKARQSAGRLTGLICKSLFGFQLSFLPRISRRRMKRFARSI